MHRFSAIGMILALMLLASPAFAQRNNDNLKLGDAAPGLDIDHWLTDEEASIERGISYLVAFVDPEDIVANSNALTIASMFIELQNAIGVSEDRFQVIVILDEDRSNVDWQIELKSRSAFDFHVAQDNKGATSTAWVDKAPIRTVAGPATFLVDTHGAIQWMGDPTIRWREFKRIAELVMHDRYDFNLFRQARPVLDTIERHRKVKNFKYAHASYEKLLEADQRIFAYHSWDRYKMALIEEQDLEMAMKLGNGFLEDYSDDPEFLTFVLRELLTDPEISDSARDTALAMRIANYVAETTDPKDPHAYYYRAMAHYHMGEVDKAIELQQRAFFLANEYFKDEYRQVLREYQQSKKGTDDSRFGRDRFRRGGGE